jgi:hypothetical protein
MTVHHVPTYLPAGLSLAWITHSWHALAVLGFAAAVVLTAGIAIGYVTAARRKPLRQRAVSTPAPSSRPPAPVAGAAPPQPSSAAVIGQRAALIRGLLTIRGIVEDPQVFDVVDDSLRAAGLTVFDPTGHTKDPRYHRVDHTEPAADPGQDGIIARALSPGHIDDGRVLKPADVVVYRWDPR